jgi:hypothetical protein
MYGKRKYLMSVYQDESVFLPEVSGNPPQKGNMMVLCLCVTQKNMDFCSLQN